MTKLFDITINGFEDIIKKFEETDKLLVDNINKATKNTVLYGEAKIKEDTPVQSGHLRQSINGEAKFFQGSIGTPVKYAPPVEYGHRVTGLSRNRIARAKQLRYLFATGVLKVERGKVLPGELHKRISTRGGTDTRTKVKGRGMFRKNIPKINRYFNEQIDKAVTKATEGTKLNFTYKRFDSKLKTNPNTMKKQLRRENAARYKRARVSTRK
ncbi:HK97 gp10 family phage protein [Vallitalea guaymasensis]|uniref:HK97 gp10 family phage protein n=1 Tax=Vallitalea guaymasensis TaxID=1185412 RepID=UPI000DE20D88|nr:HK97 gp10 family phage protein [Vallitalea guaymasensis]